MDMMIEEMPLYKDRLERIVELEAQLAECQRQRDAAVEALRAARQFIGLTQTSQTVFKSEDEFEAYQWWLKALALYEPEKEN